LRPGSRIRDRRPRRAMTTEGIETAATVTTTEATVQTEAIL
jgi:hypothetical protein